MVTNDYILSGGMDGKSRLNLLSGVLNPYTRQLLQARGVAAGSSFLDVGCGGGNVALLAATLVEKHGHVAGVDFDETIIDLARKDAEAAGLRNISFKTASAYDISWHQEFDTAYARFLLSHLKAPAKVLAKMVHSLKPGGTLIIEDVQFSGHFCHPASPAFEQYLHYYTAVAHKNGQNPETGIMLPQMLREAGLEEVGFDMIQPVFGNGPGKWMAWITLDRIKTAVAEHGIADADTLQQTLAELEAYTNDEQTVLSMPRIFRVWGKKPSVT